MNPLRRKPLLKRVSVLVLAFYALLLSAANFPSFHHHPTGTTLFGLTEHSKSAENHGNKPVSDSEEHCLLCAWQALAQEELGSPPATLPIILEKKEALPFYRAPYPLTCEAGLEPTRGPPHLLPS